MKKTKASKEDRCGTGARSFRIPDLEEDSADPWGISLSLPGVDVRLPQARKIDASDGMWTNCSSQNYPTRPSLYRF